MAMQNPHSDYVAITQTTLSIFNCLGTYLNIVIDLKTILYQVLVAYPCNPSYSGGRDQEDVVQSQPRQIVHESLSRKTLHKNRADGMAQDEDPEFKTQYCKKQNKTKLFFYLRWGLGKMQFEQVSKCKLLGAKPGFAHLLCSQALHFFLPSKNE
jgi:hypothetical protein